MAYLFEQLNEQANLNKNQWSVPSVSITAIKRHTNEKKKAWKEEMIVNTWPLL